MYNKKIIIKIIKKLMLELNNKKYFQKINTIYLFGSYALNKAKPSSDIDLAILEKENMKLTPDEYLKLYVKLSERLDPQKIDLLILNKVSPTTKHEVLSNSEMLYNIDPNYTTNFRIKFLKFYFDFKHILDDYYKIMNLKYK